MRAERATWPEEFAAFDPSRLVLVNESGVTMEMDRTYGRCARGKCVDEPMPHDHCMVTTLTAAVRLGGIPEPSCLTFVGATDANSFETYAEQCLVPVLRPRGIVVMDNLGSHTPPAIGV